MQVKWIFVFIICFDFLYSAKIKDISNGIYYDLDKNITGEINLPKSEVVYYEMENNYWCCVRPSGTEPKIKLYMGVKGVSDDDANRKLEDLKNAMVAIVK